LAVDEIVDQMSGTGHVRHHIRDMSCTREQLRAGYGEAIPNKASIEYCPGPAMHNSKKPPMMVLRLWPVECPLWSLAAATADGICVRFCPKTGHRRFSSPSSDFFPVRPGIFPATGLKIPCSTAQGV
jgi:hypothetical protein